MKTKLAGLLILFLALFAVYFSFPFALERMAGFLVVRDKIIPADVILVLAGDDNGERVDQGIELFKQGYAKKMIMSGGPILWNLTSAEWMKKQAVASGVPAEAVLVQEKSESTREDIVFSFPIMREKGFRSVILVTSQYHSRRALRTFKRAAAGSGIEVLSYPVEDGKFKTKAWWTRHEDTQRVIWEYFSIVYYTLKGY